MQIVAIGTTAADSAQSVVELARAHRGIFAAVGIHPNDAAEAAEADWPRSSTSPRRPGSSRSARPDWTDTGTGPRSASSKSGSTATWAWHTARPSGRDPLPRLHRDIIEQLRALGRPVRGVQHAFTGTWDDARAFLDLGLHLSFAGMVTFTNKTLDALRDVAARVPLDRILVETDSPYLSPHPFRGKTNEPARVAVTARRLAEIRGLPPEEFARITTDNARGLFRLPADRSSEGRERNRIEDSEFRIRNSLTGMDLNPFEIRNLKRGIRCVTNSEATPPTVAHGAADKSTRPSDFRSYTLEILEKSRILPSRRRCGLLLE